MQPFRMIITLLAVIVSTAWGQLPSNFFSGFSSGFPSFGESFSSNFGAQPQQQVPTPGNGRSSTGTTNNRPQGPVLFPPSPESRDTSGVVVGASGYGFIPPGAREISQGRGLERGPSSPAISFNSFSQPFSSSNFFNL